MTVILVVTGALGKVPKRLRKGAWRTGNQRKKRDHPNYSIVRIGQNTEKSPGHLGRLAILDFSENLQITLVWKTRKKMQTSIVFKNSRPIYIYIYIYWMLIWWYVKPLLFISLYFSLSFSLYIYVSRCVRVSLYVCVCVRVCLYRSMRDI